MKYTIQVKLKYLEGGLLPCTECGKVKSINDFARNRVSPTGYNSSCKECRKQYRIRAGVNKGKQVKKYTLEMRQELLAQGLLPCTKCDKIKPVSEFYRNSTKSFGYHTCCKDCDKKYYRKHKRRQKYPTRVRLKYFQQGLLPCARCNKAKPLSEFTKAKDNSSTGYSNTCKECQKARRTGSNYRAQYKRYHRSSSYKRIAVQYRSTGAHRKNNARYCSTEKGRKTGRAAQRKRRAKKNMVGENYTKKDEQITLKVFGQVCFRCGSTENICIDHFHCLNDGNALTITNAVPLCKVCNSCKQTKDPEEFFTKSEIKEIQKRFEQCKRIREGR